MEGIEVAAILRFTLPTSTLDLKLMAERNRFDSTTSMLSQKTGSLLASVSKVATLKSNRSNV